MISIFHVIRVCLYEYVVGLSYAYLVCGADVLQFVEERMEEGKSGRAERLFLAHVLCVDEYQ